MSEPRKSIRLMEREMDRLSALPDPLLHRILEFLSREKVGNASVHLGLKGLKEAARTSVLSKQWRFLWTNIPFFFFRNESENFEEIRDFVASVQAVLAARAASPAPLEMLSVVFGFDKCFASAVDSLIGLAAKNGVKHLSLSLESNRDYEEDDGAHPHKYALPQMIYSVSSLTSLSMSNCFAPVPETAVEWRQLKWLSIESAELPQEALDAIVKGSPLLGTLSLSACRGFDRLEIGSRRFRTLLVSLFGHECLVEISAPYARYCSLTLSTSWWWFSSIEEGITRKVVRVRNAPSLESGCINFCEGLSESYSISEADMTSAVELFQDLRHVKNLHLNNCSTKIVSLMATRGRRIPQLDVECLNIEASANYVQSIYGVIAMIESCPCLEKLVVNASSSLPEKSVVNGDEPEEDPITRDDLNCDSLHLKTVEFVDYFDSANGGEPTLTLARILLKRAPVLETMAIRKVFTTLETDGVKEALLTYPKASTEVSFSFL